MVMVLVIQRTLVYVHIHLMQPQIAHKCIAPMISHGLVNTSTKHHITELNALIQEYVTALLEHVNASMDMKELHVNEPPVSA